MLRQLTEHEKNQFKQWARLNYVPNTEINSVWHPVVQTECHRINEEIQNKSSECRTEIPEDKSLGIK